MGRLVVWACALIALTGCGDSTAPHASDLTGTWVGTRTSFDPDTLRLQQRRDTLLGFVSIAGPIDTGNPLVGTVPRVTGPLIGLFVAPDLLELVPAPVPPSLGLAAEVLVHGTWFPRAVERLDIVAEGPFGAISMSLQRVRE